MLISKKKFIYLTLDVLIIVGLLFFLSCFSQNTIQNNYFYITLLSLLTLLIQLYQMKKIGISMLSVIPIFIILLHLFHFGYYYVQAFGKEEFFIFQNPFLQGMEEKAIMGIFILCVIQAFHCGVIITCSEDPTIKHELRFAEGHAEENKNRAAYMAGIALLLISAPCRLIWDIRAIAESILNGVYGGITASSGLLDDLQFLFIPAIICIMWGKKNSPKFVKIILVIYTLAAVYVMSASGARRQYITGIFALIIAYYQLFYIGKNKKVNILSILVFGVLCLILFNTLFLIREYRHTSLGIMYLLSNHFNEFFSLDFVWETLAEFGITVESTKYAMEYFPNTIPWQYGMTYLASIIYIVPVGWLIKLNASVGGLIYAVSGRAVGGSAITDLYANFGWFAILVAPFAGILLSKLESINSNSNNLITLYGLSTGSLILSYARGGFLEILRPIVYSIIIIYVVTSFILNRSNKAKI